MHHNHHNHHNHHTGGNVKTLAYVNLIGDLVHNFVDGAVVGAVFLTDLNAGIITAVSIFAHELPQEIGDFVILIHAGYSPTKALAANFVVSLSAFAGCIITLLVGSEFEEQIAYLLPFAGGMFLYLSLACVVPELMRVQSLRANVRIFACMIFGMGLVASMLALPDHSHGGGGGGDAH
jgi:zinc and cadmium transporter